MDDTENPKKNAMKKQELEEIIRRVDIMRDRFSSMHEVILEAASGPLTEDETLDELDNVVYIMPHVKQEFEAYKDSKMPFLELVMYFEAWTDELEAALEVNKNHLHKPATQGHMLEVLGICEIIDFATKQYFNR
jgi:hypothetical protein